MHFPLVEAQVKEVDLFLAPSKFTAAMHAARGFSQPVRHLPLVVGRAYEGGRTTRPFQKPYFLFVGRLELGKGLQILNQDVGPGDCRGFAGGRHRQLPKQTA